MRHKINSEWQVARKSAVSSQPSVLLLLRRRPLRGGLLSSLFLRRFRGGSFCFRGFLVAFRRLFHFLLFLGKLGRLEGLAVEGDLSDADRTVILPMSSQLL